MPIARAADAESPYWHALAGGKLMLPRCVMCGIWHWPMVSRCGACGSWDHAWQAVEPVGTIYSYMRARHRFAGTEGLELPYTTVLVELPGAGGRRLLGLYADEESKLRIGAAVRGGVGQTRHGDRSLPVMRWHLAQVAS